MTKNKKMMISALPFVALVVLLAVFCGIEKFLLESLQNF